jgi:hypothetical protein
MTERGRTLLVALAVLALAAAWAPHAFAQGGATSTIAGSVVDASGAVVPGADVVAKNVATNTAFTAVSGPDGAFVIPAVPPGTYSVTVTLTGFKTVVLNDVIANVAQTVTVKATLELGALEETVTVASASEIIQTQATAVAATLTKSQIASLPVVGRGAFELVGFMPGVQTTTGSLRDGTINGLPQSSVNITLDGMNIQDNYAKTWDGMFTRVSPRLDAVEEVTVSTAASGADMGSQGAAQVRFVTRSGTNKFQGSAYYYIRRDWMNSNTWFNLNRNVDAVTGRPSAKPYLFQNQPGGRIGGPIIKNRAFFFVNYEWLSAPGSRTDTRTIMSPNAERGLFEYSGGTVDLMALAARNGQTARIDPLVAKTLAAVRSSTSQGTVTTTIDPTTQSFAWSQDTESTTKYPTVRLDYNITGRHQVTASGTYNHLVSDPDTTNGVQPVYPGFPVRGLQDSERYTTQISLRSVLTGTMINEFRYGATGGATLFSPNLGVDMFADYNGYALDWDIFKAINNPFPTSTNSSREGSTRVIENTLNWLKGRHSLSFGGSVTRGDVWLKNKRHVPTTILGMATGDPADAMFNATNFPGASSTDLTNARNLYAVLTGRITEITYDARVGTDGDTYNILGQSLQEGRMWQMGFFVQDGWRWRPNLTVNAGLRYEVQLPFYSLNNSYSVATMEDIFGPTGLGSGLDVGSPVTGLGNLFKPGTLQGSPTMYEMLTKDTNAYNTDSNNFAPSIGAAWTTGAESGVLRTILGAPGDSVVRGGFNIAFQRGGMSDMTEVYGDNPGILISAARNQTNGNLGTLPVLLTGSNLGPPDIPLTRVYPMAVPSRTSNVRVFDPDLKLPYATSGTIGLQRALGRNLSVEARYIHTTSRDNWTLRNTSGALNYNETNIVENNFVNEFRIAQANLVANIAAGRGSTFAYTGLPGTSPLPIFLAHLNGSTASGDTSRYTGNGWTNTTLVNSLFGLNPQPFVAANQLKTTAAYFTNMQAAGLPVNFWSVNPFVTNATVVTNGGDTRYDAIQLIVNRRYVDGLQIQANYTYGKGYQDDFYSFRTPYVEREQTYSNGSASLGAVRHVFALNWLYDLPFGQGRAFLSDAGGFLNTLIGDWSIMGTVRWQSGRMIDYGNVRLVGMTLDELRDMHELRKSPDQNNQFRTLVWMLPDDVIDNTIRAFSVSATGYTQGAPVGKYLAPANGPDCLETSIGTFNNSTSPQNAYGACGMGSVVVTGPQVFRTDITIGKRFRTIGPVQGEFQIMIFNLFNNTNFNPVGGTFAPSYVGSTKDSFQVTAATDQQRQMQMAFRVSF